MSSINLSQSNLDRSNQELNTIFDKSLIISLALLIVSFGTFFGLKYYNSTLNTKIATLNTEIGEHLKDLDGSTSMNRVVDFQERLKTIDTKIAATEEAPQNLFTTVEKLMVGGASLDSYAYDAAAKTLTLKVVSGDFKVVARQVMNFKSSGSFQNVTVSNTEKTTDGSVNSDVVISLK